MKNELYITESHKAKMLMAINNELSALDFDVMVKSITESARDSESSNRNEPHQNRNGDFMNDLIMDYGDGEIITKPRLMDSINLIIDGMVFYNAKDGIRAVMELSVNYRHIDGGRNGCRLARLHLDLADDVMIISSPEDLPSMLYGNDEGDLAGHNIGDCVTFWIDDICHNGKIIRFEKRIDNMGEAYFAEVKYGKLDDGGYLYVIRDVNELPKIIDEDLIAKIKSNLR